MKQETPIRIEGLTPEELLHLPQEYFDTLILTGRPIVFHIGSAELLGEFRLAGKRLVVELAEIRGGGEGVLLTLGSVLERYAQREKLAEVEWIVHAITCANPNLKLRRVMERRGYVVEEVPGVGLAYHKIHQIRPALDLLESYA